MRGEKKKDERERKKKIVKSETFKKITKSSKTYICLSTFYNCILKILDTLDVNFEIEAYRFCFMAVRIFQVFLYLFLLDAFILI